MFKGEQEKTIGTIEVKDGTELRAIVHRFQGRPYLNLRQFVRKPDGGWIPTKSGFTVKADLAPELADLLGKIRGEG